MTYDVAIVGAGPTGYFCAYELIAKDPSLKVVVIDKGLKIDQRHCPVLAHKIDKCPEHRDGLRECYPACSMTCGFGGAGAFSDGKFNITTEFGGWLDDYISDEQLFDLITYVDNINLHYGATRSLTDPTTEAVKKIEHTAMSYGVKLLRSKIRHLGTDENLKILKKIYADISDKVTFIFQKEVKDIKVENGQVKSVTLNDGSEIEANYVVLGVGREGSNRLNDIFEKRGITMSQNQVDVGVRVETSNLVMEEINKNLYEGKFLYRTSVGTTVRTFCSNPSGHVVVENNEGVINVNGHSYNDSKLGSDNTNFAILVSHHFEEPFNKPNEYALKVSSLANQLACGSVLIQRYGDILLGRRSTQKRIDEGFIRPTLKEAVPGDLGLCLPYKTMKSIIEMIQVLNYITPGIATEHTLLYGVEAKYYSAHPEIDKTLEVKAIKNLFVGGDGAGITRGLAQAGASGIYIARNIVAKEKK
jgi:uncharacterized FAD-dependent dehydrogenase